MGHSTPPRRILVVDDNVDAADLVAEILALQGHAVAVAHGGREALARAEAFGPDVIFLDIGMPDMDGLAVARAIRAMAPSTPVALVAVTGWGREDDRQAAFDAGFDHHITKPPDWASLGPAISAVLPARARRSVAAARAQSPSAE